MRIRNAFKIAVANFSLVFKNLLYKSIVFILFALVAGVVLNVRLKPIIDCLAKIWTEVKVAVIGAYNGEKADFALVRAGFDDLTAYLSSNYGSLFLTALMLLLLNYVFRFFSGIGDCNLLILINGYMTSLSHLGFVGTLMENLKKILVYQLINALFTLISDILTLIAVIAVAYLAFLVSPIFAVFAVCLTLVILSAVTKTVLSQITANVFVGEGKIWQLIKKGFKSEKGYFGKMFSSYLAVTVIVLYLTITVTIFTFGVGTLLVLPFASLFTVCIKEVDYFTINKKKYFLHFDGIVVPKELRENDENLLNEVEI